MSGCERLEVVPKSFEYLTCFQQLDFTDCINLKKLDATCVSMKDLRMLSFSRYENLEEMRLELKNLFKLEKLWFTNCKKLKIAHDAFEGLTSLNYLNMEECE
uniref:Uncharacterized protein n=2 Tax=Physcomitrium patens TaxID=3218 RepID=A0A7I3Z8P9_PHYPA